LPSDFRGGVVVIGNFDGVHRGHQGLLARAIADAGRLDAPALVMTFEPNPRTFFRPDEPVFRLTPGDVRARLLGALGIDGLVVTPFDAALSSSRRRNSWVGARRQACRPCRHRRRRLPLARGGRWRAGSPQPAPDTVCARCRGPVLDGDGDRFLLGNPRGAGTATSISPTAGSVSLVRRGHVVPGEQRAGNWGYRQYPARSGTAGCAMAYAVTLDRRRDR
jgi:hypothetical protein